MFPIRRGAGGGLRRVIVGALLLLPLLAACSGAASSVAAGSAATTVPPTAIALSPIRPTDAEVRATVMLLLSVKVRPDGLVEKKIPIVAGPLDATPPAMTATPRPSPTPGPVASIDILANDGSWHSADGSIPGGPGMVANVPVRINFADGTRTLATIVMVLPDTPTGQVTWRGLCPEITGGREIWVP